MLEIFDTTQEEARERLEELRKDNFNPSYAVLAREMDISHSYVVQWKNGRDVGMEAFYKILKFLEEQGY